jgi:hypothetical protein
MEDGRSSVAVFIFSEKQPPGEHQPLLFKQLSMRHGIASF